CLFFFFFFFSSRRRHTRFSRDWSSDVCSSDLGCRSLSYSLQRRSYIFHGGYSAALSPAFILSLTVLVYLKGRHKPEINLNVNLRSEERRVGKGGRDRWWWQHE